MTAAVCSFALIAAILCALLREFGFRSAKLFATLCLVLLLCAICSPLIELFSTIRGITDTSGISDAAECAIRAVGLGYAFGFTSDLCESFGEGTIASAVTIVGRIQIFLVALPYFEKVISLGMELLG